MKIVDSGYGNSGALVAARQKAWREKPFRYLIITTSGGTAGMIGGSFNYEIHGTDLTKEIVTPSVMRQPSEIIDTKTGKIVGRRDLARQYLQSISRRQRAALLEQILIKHLTGE